MINQALNYLSTAIFNYILRVNVSEACFDRNMHDLLHTSTSCHFKICLKSHTVTLLGQRLDESLLWRFRRLCRRWDQGSLYNSLTFSEELGNLRIRWPIIHQPSSDFRAVRPYRLRHLLCPDREKNEVKTAKDDLLSLVLKITHSLISIIEEFHRQGVRCVVFVTLSHYFGIS